LLALAPRTADVVQVAGGWLCDQVLAGWDVTVVTADHAEHADHEDQRALRILGVRGHDLELALASPVQLGACLQAIVVQAELYAADERVRRMVRAAAQAGRTEIRLWGGACPAGFADQADLVSHRLSAAARAFKAQALAASAAADGACPAETEEFRRAALKRPALV
jgi:hypothetical protein